MKVNLNTNSRQICYIAGLCGRLILQYIQKENIGIELNHNLCHGSD